MTATIADFDVDATARSIADRAAPKGSYGAVYELWFNAYDTNTRSLLSDVPAEHSEAVEARLIELGALKPDDYVDPREENPGLCRCYLDEMTCPNGCFEGDDPYWDDLLEESTADSGADDELRAEIEEEMRILAEDAAREVEIAEAIERDYARAEEARREERQNELAAHYNQDAEWMGELDAQSAPRRPLLTRIIDALLRR